MENKVQGEILLKLIDNALSIPGVSRKFSDPAFKSLIEKQLNICAFLIGEVTDECVKCNSKYTGLGGKFEFNSQFQYDISNLEDDINYLKIYVKNIFSIDIENFDQKNITNVKSDDIPTHTEKINIPDAVMSQINNGSDLQKNAFFLAPAQIRIQSEIKQGKIFAFDSKPKIIPVIKTITSVLLLLAGIGSLLLSIFMLLANYAVTPINDSKDVPLKINNNWSAMLDFLMACVYLYGSYAMLQPIIDKKRVNENKKYFLAWQPILFIGFFFTISLVMEIFSFNGYTIFSLIKSMETLTENASKIYALKAWYVLNIISYFSVLIIGAVVALAIFYNPKYDTKKLDELIKKYIDEMITGVKA